MISTGAGTVLATRFAAGAFSTFILWTEYTARCGNLTLRRPGASTRFRTENVNLLYLWHVGKLHQP
jgi:hypothetical protein